MPETQSKAHTGDHDEWCDDTRPHLPSSQEWEEVISVPEVRESWGLEHETTEEFVKMVYAAKFHFVSGGPGYVGELYILQGDFLTGDPPFVLLRGKGGRLEFR